VRERLVAACRGRVAAQLDALESLRNYERRVAVKNHELGEEIFDPIEEAIQKEIYARKVK